TVSGVQLPIKELKTGYDESQLTNYITTSTPGGPAYTQFNASSTTKYGQRFRSYTQVAYLTFDQVYATNDSWTNRFGVIDFVPLELSLTSKMVQSACADAAAPYWNKLLDIESVMWQPLQLTYTPTGCAQQVKMSVIQSRQISATPSECKVTLGLLPAYQYQSFVLDDTYLGILDTSRLA
ncbi:hypothetical protein UFOVP1271_1, partial [uncultured Caudovirales phage]